MPPYFAARCEGIFPLPKGGGSEALMAFLFGHVRRPALVLAVTVVVACGLIAVGTAGAAMPALYKNCTNLNEKYPHGVGNLLARDKTSGEPVTNFKRSTRLYRIAMSYNKGLDRDKDGIACEKK
jgi:hypothetical protein